MCFGKLDVNALYTNIYLPYFQSVYKVSAYMILNAIGSVTSYLVVLVNSTKELPYPYDIWNSLY